MKLHKFIFLFAFLCSVLLQAQDTVRVMHYNLLYYGVNNSFCNQTNNNLQLKNASLRKIIAHVSPDIFTVNEISSNPIYHQMILDSILNINGETRFKRATLTNYSGTSIVNGLFYDSWRFGIAKEYALTGGDRDINFYKLYYKSPELDWSSDTVFLTVIVAHLASGSDAASQAKREAEANIVMNHLATLPNPHNYLFQGDFNLYTSAEPCFQKIINHPIASIRLYDPVNKVGAWSDNPTYALYHTQSTHTSTNCFVGGGLDDRFDFIMASLPIITGSYRIKYIQGSYTTVGQDGQHFNKAITDEPVNTSAPQHVIQALYDMSDHLPVYLDLFINQTPAAVDEQSFFTVKFENPVHNIISLSLYANTHSHAIIRIFDLTGRMVFSQNIEIIVGKNDFQIPLQNLENGVYMLNILQNNGNADTFKILKL